MTDTNKDQLLKLLYKNGKVDLTRLKTKDAKSFLSAVSVPGFNSNSEKAYAILNDVSERPKCLTCDSYTNFNRVSAGYFEFCSGSCASKAHVKRGNQHHFASAEIRKKIEETNFKKYGVKTPLQIESIHEKGVEASKLVVYDRGANLLSEEYKNNRKKLIDQKLFHTQRQDVKDKIKRANKETYIEKTLTHKVNHLKSIGYELIDELKEFSRFGSNKWKHACGEIFESRPNCRFEIFCPRCRKGGISLPHQILISALNGLGVEFIVNDRKQISPKELDVFFPNKNVAVEINGIFFHNDESVGKMYHVEKTKDAMEKGIRLLHFWDFEVLTKIDCVLDTIKSALGICNKIPARKCIVKDISKNEAKSFCQSYHLNGSTNLSFAVGIFYGDTLMGCITAGTARFGKNRKKLELIRVCFKHGYQIVGGVSKMLSRIKQVYSCEIISYQDGRLGFGSVYAKCGFTLIKQLGPNYIYAKGKTFISRQKAMKHKLKDLLGESFDENLTEKENMKKAGWLICYDAGHLLWELKRS
jgi:very-short-patch-repair endonuclease